uniref:Uncharacterized protein n=1 Tax=Astyanax mexicanus TaxID=7994 RepID=A0A8B9JN84_ASTMX
MASDLQLKRAPFPQEEEEEFQQILKQIGGKGNVYLVGDVNREDGECKCSLMKEFVADVLPVDDLHREINSNGGVKSDCCPGQDGQQRKPEVGASIRAKSDKGRAMRCALVIFIFRHSYVHEKANHVCVKEVLKDVKARTVGHGAWPGLLGLVHAHSESPETRESVELLEQMLRSVFRKHPHDSIWAGHFVPKALEGVQAIRRHVCKAVLSAQATAFEDCFRWFKLIIQAETYNILVFKLITQLLTSLSSSLVCCSSSMVRLIMLVDQLNHQIDSIEIKI